MDRDQIITAFPNINREFMITSPLDSAYNCIAWAAEDTRRKWWPSPYTYWPIERVYVPTVQAFMEAFALLGYAPILSGALEAGISKIAIYIGANGSVTHMARQLANGRWTSKLGDAWDITHVSPECLNGACYGILHSYVGRHESSGA